MKRETYKQIAQRLAARRITPQLLHEAYNSAIADEAYTMPWEAVSDAARMRYHTMADHVNAALQAMEGERDDTRV